MGLLAEASYLYSFFNFGTRIGGWSMIRPERFTSKKGTRYILYWTLNGPLVRIVALLHFL